VRSGDNCFVRFDDGHTTFKRVFFESDDRGTSVVRLQPRNERYRPQTIAAAQVSGLYKAVYKYQRVDGD
jgi:repressor LexA